MTTKQLKKRIEKELEDYDPYVELPCGAFIRKAVDDYENIGNNKNKNYNIRQTDPVYQKMCDDAIIQEYEQRIKNINSKALYVSEKLNVNTKIVFDMICLDSLIKN